jgi:hypothetical protein
LITYPAAAMNSVETVTKKREISLSVYLPIRQAAVKY